MFKPMKKIVKIGDTGVKLVLEQNEAGYVFVKWETGYSTLFIVDETDKELIAALGFPTEPIEETVEVIEGVME